MSENQDKPTFEFAGPESPIGAGYQGTLSTHSTATTPRGLVLGQQASVGMFGSSQASLLASLSPEARDLSAELIQTRQELARVRAEYVATAKDLDRERERVDRLLHDLIDTREQLKQSRSQVTY